MENKVWGSGDESGVNISYGWAVEICKLISEINSFARVCIQGQYGFLINYLSSLSTLYNQIYSRMKPDTREWLDSNFKVAKENWQKYMSIVTTHGLYAERIKQKKGEIVLKMLIEIDHKLRDEMRLSGIEQQVRISGREALERDWLEKW